LAKLRVAANIDKLSELLSQQDVELAMLIHGRLKNRLRAGDFRDLAGKLLEEAREEDKLVRVKVTGPGGEYRLYAYKGMIVGAVGETSEGVLLGPKALQVLEDLREAGVIDIWEVDISALPGEVAEALGAARPSEARPPPPRGWIGLELGGFRVVAIHSEKGALNYILRAEAPWGEVVALKIPKLQPGRGVGGLEVYRLVSEAQAMARVATVDRRLLERYLDLMGYTRDLASTLERRRDNVVRVYAIHAPLRSYERAEDYLYRPPFAAMELADGDLLELERGEARDELVSALAGQVGGALALAHAIGIGHFDLKPANILYKRVDGAVMLKLSDFTGYNRVDGRFVVNLFTPEYSDPLLIAARGRGVRLDSDVFNLAALLYRVARGAPCYCIWALNLYLLSLITNRPPPDQVLRLLTSRGEAARYVEEVRNAVTLAMRERLGASAVLDRLRARYEECIRSNTSRLREPLRSALRRALTLNQRARPRDAVDFYARNLLSLA